jgi:hypothetical protein
MGPGFRLMQQNQGLYATMASLADVWVLQTQQLQKEPPGPGYRQAVESIVSQIRSGHPGIPIWAQITFPPDREPDVGEWLAYEDMITDLLEGRTYVAAYTWGRANDEELAMAIEGVFRVICGSEP